MVKHPGCEYGKANRQRITVVGALWLAMVGVVTILGGMTATAMNRIEERQSLHGDQITAQKVDGGRIEERLTAMQRSLERIERMMERKGTE